MAGNWKRKMDHSNGVRTALSVASEQGDFELVCGVLGRNNLNVNFANIEGRSPISYAAGNGHAEISKTLLQHGANAHLPDLNGRTPLSWAAGGGHISTVRLLLSPVYNVNANSQDGLGQTPFIWACANGHLQVVNIFLAQHNIFPAYPTDYNGNPPLSIAAANGRESVIRILLTYENVIQGWVMTSWKEDMAKDAWKAKNPGAWSFRATIAWDHIISNLPQNKAMAHGHWGIAKLLRLHWESLDMGKYPIADIDKAKYTETINSININTHGYWPLGSGSYYPYGKAAGDVGMPAYDESITTNNPGPSDNNFYYYPYEQAAGAAGIRANDKTGNINNPSLFTYGYTPSDNYYSNYPNKQAAGSVGMPVYDESRNTSNPDLYFNEPSEPTYAKSSTSEGPAGETINNTPMQQTATATKKSRKRYRKPKATKTDAGNEREAEEVVIVERGAAAERISVALLRKGIRSNSI